VKPYVPNSDPDVKLLKWDQSQLKVHSAQDNAGSILSQTKRDVVDSLETMVLTSISNLNLSYRRIDMMK
jgi:hypothetical protein